MSKDKRVVIEILGGCLMSVSNLPKGWDYELIDHDEKLAGESSKPEVPDGTDWIVWDSMNERQREIWTLGECIHRAEKNGITSIHSYKISMSDKWETIARSDSGETYASAAATLLGSVDQALGDLV